MTRDPSELVSRHFDDLLSEDEHRALQGWLRSAPEHVKEFARVALLHDRLRGEQIAITLVSPAQFHQPSPVRAASGWRWRSLVLSSSVAAVIVGGLLVALEVGKTPAAATELQRLIAVQGKNLDRTYRIAVEDALVAQQKHPPVDDDGRPPKPPLDGAVLHVRRGRQFVLIRRTADGQDFVTGCNGRTSWAVRPDGPVRVSADLTRFHRDLPGHEHDFPLMEIERGLAHLQRAYDIQLLPIENADDRAAADLPIRLLVAVKKRGHRGPRRVEISYAVRTGQIRQLRFVEMPYGPERLTVRLTQEEERPLGPDFFDHPSHHAADRVVEEE